MILKCQIERVILNPNQRNEYVKHLLELEGLENINEDPNACYCAIPLTGVPENIKANLAREHDTIKQCIQNAGIKIYDPKDAPGNPWFGIKIKPEKLYDADTIQVVTPKFFELTNIAPSTGSGIEQQKAIVFNKIAIVIVKSGIYVSRMSTGAKRTILLEYDDIKKCKDDITSVFVTLKDYSPGIGNCSIHGNVIAGFKDSDNPVCLKGLIKEKFPNLVYNFDKSFDKYMTNNK